MGMIVAGSDRNIMGISVTFLPDGITVLAEPGELLLAVASRAGVEIPTGCLMGSCHACEVELAVDLPFSGADGAGNADSNAASPIAQSTASQTVCACISAVPAGSARVTVTLGIDPTW